MRQRLLPYVSQMVSLLLVFLMLSAAAVWTGSLFGRAIGPSASLAGQEDLALRPDSLLLRQLGLSAAHVSLTPADSAAWTVTATDGGEELGHIVYSQRYAPETEGFAGPTPLYIYIDAAGTVAAAAPGPNAETADFFAEAYGGIAPAYVGLPLAEAAGRRPDAVTGATYSSHSLIENFYTTLSARANAEAAKASRRPVPGWPRTVAVIGVLLLGVIVSWRFRRVGWIAVVVRLLNVGVLGFWCGQFLSLTMLRDWVARGFDPVASLGAVVMLMVAVLMPLCHRPHHYCSWTCPLGSAQWLLGRLPLPKVHCSERVTRFFSRLRLALFSLLMLLLWAGVGAEWLDYEPFSAFLVTSAAPAVLVLAGSILVASCFVPQLWCRALCPVGQLLELAEHRSPSLRRDSKLPG